MSKLKVIFYFTKFKDNNIKNSDKIIVNNNFRIKILISSILLNNGDINPKLSHAKAKLLKNSAVIIF